MNAKHGQLLDRSKLAPAAHAIESHSTDRPATPPARLSEAEDRTRKRKRKAAKAARKQGR